MIPIPSGVRVWLATGHTDRFPYPDPDGTGVRFLETPATVWNAQSVLIDEISRSKPEQQNRVFSLVHERKVQGIALPRLRYRWAAMNPCSADQDSDENYTGSEPLDPALADRFALFVHALDWGDLSDDERRRIAEPVGEAEGANDLGKVATPILSVDGEMRWQEPHSQSGTVHPELERFAEVIGGLTGGRAERARQFFNWCLVERVAVADPAGLESEFDGCVELIRQVQAA
jgi:MoxR-like ATPase